MRLKMCEITQRDAVSSLRLIGVCESHRCRTVLAPCPQPALITCLDVTIAKQFVDQTEDIFATTVHPGEWQPRGLRDPSFLRKSIALAVAAVLGQRLQQPLGVATQSSGC